MNMIYQDEDQQRIAEGIFRWLLCAQQIWTTDLFLLALSRTFVGDEITIDAVFELTLNLIVHDKELNIFRFAHLSVREFLEEDSSNSLDSNHTKAAITCFIRPLFTH